MASTSEPDWGGSICADLAVDQVLQAAGRDVWAELGGRPAGWRQAADLYRRQGCTSLDQIVSKVLGPPVDPRLAVRGDVVMIRGALGICRGELVECLDAMQPLRLASAAWRVPGPHRPSPERTAPEAISARGRS